jgi:hypothetical protein
VIQERDESDLIRDTALTSAGRSGLAGLARATKVEFRLRQRAQIVLMAADGLASWAIRGRLAVPLVQHLGGGRCASDRLA